MKRWKYQLDNLVSTWLIRNSHFSFNTGDERRLLSSLPSQIQAVGERLQLLLPQPLLLLQVLLPDEQRGLGLDKVPVVLQLLGRQLAGQEGGDHVLPAVQVILQIFGILSLFTQQTVAAVQRLLSGETERSLCRNIAQHKH